MAQFIVCYDPKNRIEMRQDRLPHDASHIALVIPDLPRDPVLIEQLAHQLAALLLTQLTAVAE